MSSRRCCWLVARLVPAVRAAVAVPAVLSAAAVLEVLSVAVVRLPEHCPMAMAVPPAVVLQAVVLQAVAPPAVVVSVAVASAAVAYPVPECRPAACRIWQLHREFRYPPA